MSRDNCIEQYQLDALLERLEWDTADIEATRDAYFHAYTLSPDDSELENQLVLAMKECDLKLGIYRTVLSHIEFCFEISAD